MASPLMSLASLGTIKHVVPWKSRQEFINVYEDLYSEDVVKQKQAINRIATWKSRSWNKLSVAIESSSNLQQVLLEYSSAQSEGCLQEKEAQLKANCSLALIRFVNHITEKAQTKQAAQPVHLVAREFGIPEWIVRTRHDATHGTMPCLDVLVKGVQWALSYLKEKFWMLQLDTDGGKEEEPGKDPQSGKLKMSSIRETLYDFQKARYQEMNSVKDEDKKDSKDGHNGILNTLQSYFSKNRLQFIKCFLEDGILVATQEQLAVFGVWAEDLLSHSPPTIPVEISEFWRPVLRMVYNSGGLPLLLHCAMFSVTTETGLKNYQLVAWLIYFLAQSTDSRVRSKRRKKKKQEDLVKGQLVIPKKTLLAACLQNINSYTVHLLKFLADRESLGSEAYDKMTALLKIDVHAASREKTRDSNTSTSRDKDTGTTSRERDVASDGQESTGRDLTSDGTESDTDYTVYTVEDLKKEKERTHKTGDDSSTVIEVQNSIEEQDVPWAVCTDLVDWSSVPFGVIPTPMSQETDDEEDEDEEESHKTDDKGDDDEEEDINSRADLSVNIEEDSRVGNSGSDATDDGSKLLHSSSDEQEEEDKKGEKMDRKEREYGSDSDGPGRDRLSSPVKRKRGQSSEEESDEEASRKRPALISSEEVLTI